MLMDTIKVLDSAGEIKKQDGTTKYVGASLYDIAGSTFSIPTSLAQLMRFTAARAFTLPASLVGSQVASIIAPTAGVSYSIAKNGTQIGTMDFTAANNVGTFTMASSTSFAIGDILTVVAPATPDSTHNELAWTFAASPV